MPITTFFFSFEAIFKTSNVHFGIVKSIITFALPRAFSVFNSGLIPLIFLLIVVYSISNLALRENMSEFKNALSQIESIDNIK